MASVARIFEADCARNMGATTHPVPVPPILGPAISDRIELAVCGAHMAGLPLNGQLVECGARFVRSAQTTLHYYFYALAGGPLARPGLVRSNDPDGVSVSLEIWSMPKSMFGSFIEAIPAPLGIGSIELSDGTWVKGFLCEASGTAGATDISHLGSWRAFLAS